MTEPTTYACYIRFPCPACGFVILPPNFAVGPFNSNLYGLTLEQAYGDGTITLETVQSILAKEFLCDLENKLVRPADAEKVILVEEH